MKFKDNAIEVAIYKVLMLISNILLVLATLLGLTWVLTIGGVFTETDTSMQFIASVMSATYIISAGFLAIIAMQLRYIAAGMVSE